MRRYHTVFNGRIVNERLVIIQPCDNIRVLRCTERCLVRCITRYTNQFRRPTCKRVCVFGCCSLACVRVRGHDTIFYCRLVNERIVVVQPSDCVLVLSSAERCLVRSITRYCYRSVIPTCKRIGKLSSSSLGCVRVRRYYTIFNGCLVNERIVIIQPSNCVRVLRCTERCLVRCITCYSHWRVIPTCERVSKLSCILLGCINMCRHYAILNGCLVNQRLVIIQPCDSIRVLRCIEGSLIRCITRHTNHFRRPTCERVSEFSCILLGCVRVRRYYTIFNGCLVNQRVIIVQPCDGVRVLRCAECCLVRCITRYTN